MLSRVADNLYWMSRYLERAEHTARLIDVSLDLILDQPPGGAHPYWARLFASLNVPLPRNASEEAYGMTQRIVFDLANANSLVSCIASARENARQVREQISSEMWEQINSLFLYARRTRLDEIWDEEPHKFFLDVKEGAHLFQGITDGTMNHNQGWHFIQVGRFIERSMATATLLDVHYDAFFDARAMETDNYQDWVALLKSCTAFEAYCKVHTADLIPQKIAEFLLLDNCFPHAVFFSVNAMQNALRSIGDFVKARKTGRISRLAGRLQAALEYSQIEEIMAGDFHAYLYDIQEQCKQLHNVVYQTYIEYPIDQEVLT